MVNELWILCGVPDVFYFEILITLIESVWISVEQRLLLQKKHSKKTQNVLFKWNTTFLLYFFSPRLRLSYCSETLSVSIPASVLTAVRSEAPPRCWTAALSAPWCSPSSASQQRRHSVRAQQVKGQQPGLNLTPCLRVYNLWKCEDD